MRVLLIDDHELLWASVCRLAAGVSEEVAFRGSFGFEAVRSVEEALNREADGFDLVLLDYHLGGLSGLQALAAVRSHFDGVPVCALSGETEPERIRDMLEAGACGFIPKQYGLRDLEAALRTVLRHRVYVPPEFVLVTEATRAADPDEVSPEDLARYVGAQLSPRQREVLALVMQGLPHKSVARRLGIAEGTVKAHLAVAYRALGVHSKTDALCRIFRAQAASACGLR